MIDEGTEFGARRPRHLREEDDRVAGATAQHVYIRAYDAARCADDRRNRLAIAIWAG
jgi:hypothetical protein